VKLLRYAGWNKFLCSMSKLQAGTVEQDARANSKLQHWILLFFTFVRLLLANTNVTDFYSMTNMKWRLAKKWWRFPSTTAVASFSTGGQLNSHLLSDLDAKAVGLSVTEIATSDASHSTTNGRLSSIACDDASSKPSFRLKSSKDFTSKCKFVTTFTLAILSEKHGNHLA